MTPQDDPGRAFQRGCGLYALGILFLFTLVVIFAKIRADHFWDNGVHIEGVVISVDAKRGSMSSNFGRIVSETIHFEYLVNGQPFRHRQTFSGNTRFYVGQPIPVIYLPDTPWTAEIRVDQTIDPVIVLVTGGGILVLLGLSIRLYRDSLSNKQKRKEKPLA